MVEQKGFEPEAPALTEYPAECAVFFAQLRRTLLSENLFANDSAENISNGQDMASPRSRIVV